jgi:hypothetical protein
MKQAGLNEIDLDGWEPKSAGYIYGCSKQSGWTRGMRFFIVLRERHQ